MVILTISLFVSLKSGNDFGQANFAKFVTFIISCGLLRTVYYLSQSVLADVPLKLQNGQRKETILLTEQESEIVQENSKDNHNVEQVQVCQNEVILCSESIQAPLSEELQDPTIEASSEQPDLYALRCKEFQREQEQRRQDTIAAIMEYVTHTMSPYIYDDGELEKLCEDIKKWADNWQHNPVGSKKDYTGEVRAMFIKRMFPDVMKDIELDSIRNFKFQPDTGSIMIDEPDKGDYHFHYE